MFGKLDETVCTGRTPGGCDGREAPSGATAVTVDRVSAPRRSGYGRIGRGLVWVLGGVALAYVLNGVIHVVVWRARWQPGIDALRWFHKRARPMEMRSAGKSNKATAAVHHTGRRSGKHYVTPVWAHRVDDRFYIGLPYGTGVDWCRNVLAAGGGAVEHDGMRYDVTAPVIVSARDAPRTLAGTRRSMLELMGIESFLRLDVTPASPAAD